MACETALGSFPYWSTQSFSEVQSCAGQTSSSSQDRAGLVGHWQSPRTPGSNCARENLGHLRVADNKAGGKRALCHARKENSLVISASSVCLWSPKLPTTAWAPELTPQLAPTPWSGSSALPLTSLLLESKDFGRARIPFSTGPQGPQIQRLQHGLFHPCTHLQHLPAPRHDRTEQSSQAQLGALQDGSELFIRKLLRYVPFPERSLVQLCFLTLLCLLLLPTSPPL